VEDRGYAPWLEFLDEQDLVRELPPQQDAYPECWPAGRRRHWLVATRAWDVNGELGSIHARVPGLPPRFDVGTDREHSGPKTLWPKHPDPENRYQVSGLFFADRAALAIARGEPPPSLERVFFTEGLTDWVAAACHVAGGECSEMGGYGRSAVFGGFAGSFSTLGRLPFPTSGRAGPLRFLAALDPDPPGRRYLLKLAEGLHPRPVARIPLERWREAAGKAADDKLDLSDVLLLGGPVSDLVDAAEPVDVEALRSQVAAERVTARAADRRPTQDSPGRTESAGAGRRRPLPKVNPSDRQMADIIEDAWKAVHETNSPPTLFLRAGYLARIRLGREGRARIEELNRIGMQGVLARSARWTRWRKATAAETSAGLSDPERQGYVEVERFEPPKYLAPDMVDRPDLDLPQLDAVVAVPVFDSHGQLVLAPGYSPSASLWFEPPAGFSVPETKSEPTDRDLADARDLLLDTWLGDFPFVKSSDRAHAIAIALLPFVRRLIHSPTPLHLVEASVQGTGKSLLAACLVGVAYGGPPPPITYTANDEEMRKVITAFLSEGSMIMFLDNIQGLVKSASLARALTSEQWKDRKLGTNASITCDNRATWVATANNATLNTDIARRSVRVRLDREMERPWEWSGARIEDLEGWTALNRERLIAALLTLVQGWMARGRPPGERTIGTFGSWARVMGGILRTAGIEGFLEDMSDLYEDADSEMAEWYAFVRTWWEKMPDHRFEERVEATADHPGHQHPTRTVTMRASELGAFARAEDLLGGVLGDGSERSQNSKLGRALGGLRDRVMEGLTLRRKKGRKGSEYWLERVA